MSFGWSSGIGNPAQFPPTSSLPLSLGGGPVGYGTGGWGTTGYSANSLQQQRLQDEAKFNALFPVAGLVTGEQVKPIFESSGLQAPQLAQIWASVDKDKDGKINKAEFCTAMNHIRTQQKASHPSASLSSAPGVSGFSGVSGFASSPGSLPKSWSMSGFKAAGQSAAAQSWDIKPQETRKYLADFNTLDINKSGFLSGAEVRTVLSKSGLDKMILAKIWELSDIDKDGRLSSDEYVIAMHLTAKVRGGASLPSRLPSELYPGPTKYHTIDRAAATKTRPALEKKASIPEKLGQSPTMSGKGQSQSPGMSGHARTPSGGGGHVRNSSAGTENISFEDRRKENFEAGRMELERRRKAIKEQQEREAAEKERKKREEEERRLQQEHEAELARQAELERQRRKALEIEQERERQMQLLAKKREEEERELERKRKIEWAKKKCVELEGQRDWEKKSLHSLRVQHSQLEDQLRQLDQKKLSTEASTQRQRAMFTQIILDLKTMRVSHELGRAEITKLQSELNGYHTQLSSLQRQRRELRESLQARSPEMSLYQQQRQELKDKIIGLAASLAGFKSNISHNTKSIQDFKDLFKSNSQLMVDLKKTFESDNSAVGALRQQVLHQKAAFEEAQRLERLEAEHREAEERRERQERQEREKRERQEREKRERQERQERERQERQERERQEREKRERQEREKRERQDRERREREEKERREREAEENANREARLEKIKRNQDVAITKAKVQRVQQSVADSQPELKPPPLPAKRSKTPPSSAQTPPSEPPHPLEAAGNWSAEDEALKKKVQELQKKKTELQKQREKGKATPGKPTGSADKKAEKVAAAPEIKPKGKLLKQESTDKTKAKAKKGKGEKEAPSKAEQLVDLNSSWDSTAQTSPGISSFAKDTSQILVPLKTVQEEEGDAEGGGSPAKRSLHSPTSPKPKAKPHSASVSPEPMGVEDTTVRRFSVAKLSELFDRGVSPVERGWSAHIAPATNTSANTASSSSAGASTSPISPTPPVTANSGSPAPGTGSTSPVTAGTSYSVLYSYQATDDTEATVTQGDIVTFIPREDASPGWMMVQLSGGSEGWVPEAYLQVAAEPEGGRGAATVKENVEGVSKATGQHEAVEPSSSGSLSPQPVQAKVLFSWKGSKENHLSLVKGEVVQVLQQSDKWWSGEHNGSVGWFPKTFVKILDTPAEPHSQPKPQKPSPQDTPHPQQKPPLQAKPSPQQKPPLQAKPSPQQRPPHQTKPSLLSKPPLPAKVRASNTPSAVPGPQATATTKAPPTAETQDLHLYEVMSSVDTPTQAQATPAEGMGVQYEAIYDFIGEGEEPSFKTGDVIEVMSSDGDWWTGKLNGVFGTFPSNYLQKKEGSSSSPTPSSSSQGTAHPQGEKPPLPPLNSASSKPTIARVLVDYHSTKAGQLNLAKGQLLKVLKQNPNGWWEGEVQSRGKKKEVGWFPANRVELLSKKSSPAHSMPEPSKIARAKSPLLEALEDGAMAKSSSANLVLALYTYTAQSADELSFHKGSVITILDKEGEWWKGEVNDKTGLFPSNYVQPLTEQQPSGAEPTRWADSVSSEVLASVSDKERKRQEAIFELLTSERNYVNSLKLVQEVFFDPMAQAEVLTEEEMAKVMVNWDELIKCSGEFLSSFLVRLRTSGELVRGIGDVLTSQIPNLTPHIRWCSCQLNACLILQQKSSDPKFKEFETKCLTDPRTGGLPLSSFLLKPMQRVTKYPLLIKRILDYTSPSDNDYADLKSALTEAETLCDHVNDAVRQKENTEQLEWLQSHVFFTQLDEKLVFNSQTNFMGQRKLLHWGKLFKIRGSRDLVGFLFNDFLMLVRPKLFFPKAASPVDLDPWGKNEFQMYRKPYLLDAVKAKKAGSDATGGALISLQVSSPDEKDILLRVDAESVRNQWLKLLTKAGVDFITTKKKIEKEKLEQHMRTMQKSVGWMDVTVVKGVDLLAKDPNGKSDPFCVIRLGDQQEQTTPVIQGSLNPKWNFTMTFAVFDINKDILDITVFDKDLFSPNDFLGCGRLSVKDLLRDGDSPWEKTVLLENVSSGEVVLNIALTLSKSALLLE